MTSSGSKVEELIAMLRAVEPRIKIETCAEDTIRVSLPGGPSMRIRRDYFTHVDAPDHLRAYAERVVEKLHQEGK